MKESLVLRKYFQLQTIYSLYSAHYLFHEPYLIIQKKNLPKISLPVFFVQIIWVIQVLFRALSFATRFSDPNLQSPDQTASQLWPLVTSPKSLRLYFDMGFFPLQKSVPSILSFFLKLNAVLGMIVPFFLHIFR